jgi:hypothetical protein
MIGQIQNKGDKYLNGTYAEFWIEDGLLFAKYKQGVYVNIDVAHKLLEERELFCEGKAYAAVWECSGVTYWTREARAFMGSLRNHKYMKAAAGVYPASYAAYIVINFFLKVTKPVRPSRFFTSMDDAIEWTKKFR